MIAFVNGCIEQISEDNVVIEVGGIGYNVRISADTSSKLPAVGQSIKLYTYTCVREDAFLLYGFLRKEDLEIFRKCITVSGIGPKGALAILSVMDADSLRFAIVSGDTKAIAKAPGIGARTAERLVLELKDKLKLDDDFINREMESNALSIENGSLDTAQKTEAIEALVALGYGRAESMKAVSAIDGIESMEAGAILKAALKKMF